MLVSAFACRQVHDLVDILDLLKSWGLMFLVGCAVEPTPRERLASFSGNPTVDPEVFRRALLRARGFHQRVARGGTTVTVEG